MTYANLKHRFGWQRIRNVLHVSRRFNYVYLSNPKAACSSIKQYLSQAEVDDPELSPRDVHDRKYLPLLHLGQLEADEREGICDGRFFAWTFVRDPIRRAVSAYADKIAGSKEQKAEILEALDRDPKNLSQPVTFDEFVSVIVSQPPETLNPHWRPQIFNLTPDLIPYQFIGRVERMDRDFNEIKRRLAMPDYPLPKRNVKTARLNIDELMTDHNRKRLCILYSNDLRRFGYAKKWRRMLRLAGRRVIKAVTRS